MISPLEAPQSFSVVATSNEERRHPKTLYAALTIATSWSSNWTCHPWTASGNLPLLFKKLYPGILLCPIIKTGKIFRSHYYMLVIVFLRCFQAGHSGAKRWGGFDQEVHDRGRIRASHGLKSFRTLFADQFVAAYHLPNCKR